MGSMKHRRFVDGSSISRLCQGIIHEQISWIVLLMRVDKKSFAQVIVRLAVRFQHMNPIFHSRVIVWQYTKKYAPADAADCGPSEACGSDITKFTVYSITKYPYLLIQQVHGCEQEKFDFYPVIGGLRCHQKGPKIHELEKPRSKLAFRLICHFDDPIFGEKRRFLNFNC